MDASKEYIDMCWKAKKFLWTKDYYFRFGSLFIYESGKILSINWEGTWPERKYTNYFPLWQQDQLQEMIESETDDYGRLIKITNWIWPDNKFYSHKIMCRITAEQLWLTFILYKKFNKKWSENNWEERDIV